MNLVALLCVRSTCFNSSTDCGAHVCVAYPRCGLTRARYSVRRTAVLLIYRDDLRMYPSNLFAFVDCLLACLFHLFILAVYPSLSIWNYLKIQCSPLREVEVKSLLYPTSFNRVTTWSWLVATNLNILREVQNIFNQRTCLLFKR